LNQIKAHGFGGFLQYIQLSGLEFFLAVFQPLADIGFAVLDQAVNVPCRFMRCGRESFRRAAPGFHAAVEATQRALVLSPMNHPYAKDNEIYSPVLCGYNIVFMKDIKALFVQVTGTEYQPKKTSVITPSVLKHPLANPASRRYGHGE